MTVIYKMKLKSRATRKIRKLKTKRTSASRTYRRNSARSGGNKNSKSTYKPTKTTRHRHRRSHQQRGRQMKMKGGFGPGAGPQGIAWSGSPADWPHQSSTGEQVGSYLSLSKVGIPAGPFDPPKLSNGVTGEFPPKFLGGGGISFAQDLTNFVRQGVDSISNIAAGFKGVQPPISSDVTVQPIAQTTSVSPLSSSPMPINFKAIQTAAAEDVRGLSD